jgi:hypothetical protein
MPTDEQIRQALFRKMLYQGYIGGKHTSYENLPKGFPRDIKKRVEKVVDNLIKEGYFIVKPKPDSYHLSLDPKRLTQVKREIGEK